MQSMDLEYKTLSDRFKLLAHPERLRILDVLRRQPECVCHLEALLDKPQPYVSQQLRFLRTSGVITDEKRGQHVFYRLSDEEIARWLDLFLGVADGQHPALAAYKQVISCGCPNCTPETNSAPPAMTIAEK
jgi:DNA-binding transcriptional ArsR family regulator